jgi:hypothetical protein
LTEWEEEVFRSPVREQLCQRLLTGDAVVWLVIKGKDAEKNRELHELLDQEFARLGKALSLPDGIGEPGSELYADVPLYLKFTYLELDPQQPKEKYFARFLMSLLQPATEGADLSARNSKVLADLSEPLLVPVFGRGRALEVIPASQVDQGLIEDLTVFLCGPCSCQVKESNPGFDLLLAVDWEKDLFGEGVIPPSSSSQAVPAEPKLLPIPSGRK